MPTQIRGKTQIKERSISLDRIEKDVLAGEINSDYDANNRKIINLSDPINEKDAVNKRYVDNSIQGLNAKKSVRAATTENIFLSGIQTIDGVSLQEGDRVLVKNQNNPAENGIYIVSQGVWNRSEDANTIYKLVSAYVFVEEGNTNLDTGFVCIVDKTGELGLTPIEWIVFSHINVVGGIGIEKVGNTLNIGNVLGIKDGLIREEDDLKVAVDNTTIKINSEEKLSIKEKSISSNYLIDEFINSLNEKSLLNDNDVFFIEDGNNFFNKKKITFQNLLSNLNFWEKNSNLNYLSPKNNFDISLINNYGNETQKFKFLSNSLQEISKNYAKKDDNYYNFLIEGSSLCNLIKISLNNYPDFILANEFSTLGKIIWFNIDPINCFLYLKEGEFKVSINESENKFLKFSNEEIYIKNRDKLFYGTNGNFEIRTLNSSDGIINKLEILNENDQAGMFIINAYNLSNNTFSTFKLYPLGMSYILNSNTNFEVFKDIDNKIKGNFIGDNFYIISNLQVNGDVIFNPTQQILFNIFPDKYFYFRNEDYNKEYIYYEFNPSYGRVFSLKGEYHGDEVIYTHNICLNYFRDHLELKSEHIEEGQQQPSFYNMLYMTPSYTQLTIEGPEGIWIGPNEEQYSHAGLQIQGNIIWLGNWWRDSFNNYYSFNLIINEINNNKYLLIGKHDLNLNEDISYLKITDTGIFTLKDVYLNSEIYLSEENVTQLNNFQGKYSIVGILNELTSLNFANDIVINQYGKGIVLTASDNSQWRIGVFPDGSLYTESI